MKLAKNKKWILNYLSFWKFLTFSLMYVWLLLPPDSKGFTLLATKELSSLGCLNLVPSAVFSLKIDDVWTIVLYLSMIQPLGTRLSTQEPKKSQDSALSFFQPSNLGNRRSDAWLLNLIGGIYIFVFLIFILLSLYNNCHIKSLTILICHDWR